MMHWNDTLWLVKGSRVTIFNQSEAYIFLIHLSLPKDE